MAETAQKHWKKEKCTSENQQNNCSSNIEQAILFSSHLTKRYFCFLVMFCLCCPLSHALFNGVVACPDEHQLHRELLDSLRGQAGSRVCADGDSAVCVCLRECVYLSKSLCVCFLCDMQQEAGRSQQEEAGGGEIEQPAMSLQVYYWPWCNYWSIIG